jgi:hypothetical protein
VAAEVDRATARVTDAKVVAARAKERATRRATRCTAWSERRGAPQPGASASIRSWRVAGQEPSGVGDARGGSCARRVDEGRGPREGLQRVGAARGRYESLKGELGRWTGRLRTIRAAQGGGGKA